MKNSLPTQLLSPAGGPEAGYAALRYGADAVYCGLRSFSARAEAVNFTPDELRELVHYAHGLEKPREVFVTLNTLMSESERHEVSECIITAAESGADALIVQDMGVARLAREIAPALELHASTQMAIHNIEGARVAAKWGFGQITLARELTFDEIRRIASEGIKTEVFIHGALCYSYSGLCLMSALRNDRSGNRGHCAYPCRDRYAIPGTDASGLAFSMKDLALGDEVLKLADMGVSCLKIEGRMKSPLYVASATDYYRRILDGDFRSASEMREAEEDLRTVFSRKWTHLHADAMHHTGVVNPEITGHRGVPIGTVNTVRSFPDGTRWLRFTTNRALQLHDGLQIDLPGQDRPYGFAIDKLDTLRQSRGIVFECQAGDSISVLLPEDAPHIPSDATLYCSSSQAIKQRFDTALPPASERKPRTPIDITVRIRPQELRLEAHVAGDDAVSTEAHVSDTYTAAKNPDRIQQSIADSCGKLGESEFSLHSLTIDNPEALFTPMSQLNELRRQLCESLSASLVAASSRRHADAMTKVDQTPPRVPETCAERWIVKTDQPRCLERLEGVDEVILEIACASDEAIVSCVSRYGAEHVRLALPIIIRAWESEAIRARVAALVNTGCKRWMAPNPDAWNFIPPGCDIETDWTLSAWNSQSISEWLEHGATGVTLSPENTVADLAGLLAEWGDIATVILYQDTPLMISEACPLSALGAECGPCHAKKSDSEPVQLHPVRGGEDVFVTSRNCRTVITNENPYSAAEAIRRLRASGGRNWRIDFSIRPYTANEALEIWRRLRQG